MLGSDLDGDGFTKPMRTPGDSIQDCLRTVQQVADRESAGNAAAASRLQAAVCHRAVYLRSAPRLHGGVEAVSGATLARLLTQCISSGHCQYIALRELQ